MGIIAREVFVKNLLASPAPMKGGKYDPNIRLSGLRGEVANAIGLHYSTPPAWIGAADEATAIECYDAIRAYVVANGYVGGKLLRPWNLDPGLTKNLNRDEVWWGWEFETGYRGIEQRGRAVGHCWDNYDGVIFDSEGEGNAAVEITFTPQEQSKFRDGTAQALRFMNWLSENRDLTQKTNSTNIGTHLNISHPKLTVSNLGQVVQCMNRTVGALEQTIDGVGSVRQALFGRAHLYGGFYPQNQASGVWMEGKLFRTTYNAKEFARYVQAAHGLSDALEVILNLFSDAEWKWQFSLGNYPYVANLYEMVTENAAPVVRWASGKNPINGTHNGGGWELSNTLNVDKCPQTRADAEAEIKRKEEEERQRKIKEEEARLAALREAEEEKARRAMHAKGERPKNLPKDHTWCDDCGDWHEE